MSCPEPLERIFRQVEEESERRAEEAERQAAAQLVQLDKYIQDQTTIKKRLRSSTTNAKEREFKQRRRGSISISRLGQYNTSTDPLGSPTLSPLPPSKLASDSPFYQSQIAAAASASRGSVASCGTFFSSHSGQERHARQASSGGGDPRKGVSREPSDVPNPTTDDPSNPSSSNPSRHNLGLNTNPSHPSVNGNSNYDLPNTYNKTYYDDTTHRYPEEEEEEEDLSQVIQIHQIAPKSTTLAALSRILPRRLSRSRSASMIMPMNNYNLGVNGLGVGVEVREEREEEEVAPAEAGQEGAGSEGGAEGASGEGTRQAETKQAHSRRASVSVGQPPSLKSKRSRTGLNAFTRNSSFTNARTSSSSNGAGAGAAQNAAMNGPNEGVNGTGNGGNGATSWVAKVTQKFKRRTSKYDPLNPSQNPEVSVPSTPITPSIPAFNSVPPLTMGTTTTRAGVGVTA